MALSHKTKVVIQYLVPVATAYFIIATFFFTGAIPTASDLTDHVGGIAGLTVAATLAQDIVPKSLKEFLVFFRLRSRLPGHRAFTELFHRSDRYDISRISNLGELSSLSSDEQQRVFYGIYRKHSDGIRVQHYSFRYLAWRDSASTLCLLSLVTIPVLGGFPEFGHIIPALKLTIVSLVGYVSTAFAARYAADELICQVLIAETLEGAHDISK